MSIHAPSPDNEFDRLEIAKNWLPRYTGMPIDEFGDYILMTNFHDYMESFANRFDCEIHGAGRPMQAATNSSGLSMINFGIGSANAATIMDLMIARRPKGVLFLGKCGGLKATTEIGHFILPIAAIRGEGTSLDYFPADVPALPSFKLHKSCRIEFWNETWSIGPELCIPPIDDCGSTITSFARS